MDRFFSGDSGAIACDWEPPNISFSGVHMDDRNAYGLVLDADTLAANADYIRLTAHAQQTAADTIASRSVGASVSIHNPASSAPRSGWPRAAEPSVVWGAPRQPNGVGLKLRLSGTWLSAVHRLSTFP